MIFETKTVPIYYRVVGSGSPSFLVLHGTSGWGESFAPLLPYLTPEHQVFIPDLRGHGHSGHVANGYGVLDFAQDMIELLDAMATEPVVLIGHSLGGLVGIAVAAQRPELVQALVIEDAPLWLRRFSVKEGSQRAYDYFLTLARLLDQTQQEAEILARLPQVAPDALAREGETLAARLALLDVDVLHMSYDSRLMAGFDIDASLSKITCPTLLLQADVAHGGSLGDKDVGAAISQLAQGITHFVAGSGHTIHREQPEQMADRIKGWLNS